jgi:hypothetical protein
MEFFLYMPEKLPVAQPFKAFPDFSGNWSVYLSTGNEH